MKNKHLLLLFLLTLIIGLGFRHFPWRLQGWFERPLIEISPESIESLSILLPERDTLLLVKGERNWQAFQHDRSAPVSAEKLQAILNALQSIRMVRVLESKNLDSLGFTPQQQIAIECTLSDAGKTRLFLGNSSQYDKATYTWLYLGKGDLAHLVRGDLRPLFSLSMRDFRNNRLFNSDDKSLQQVHVPGDSLGPFARYRRDSLHRVEALLKRLQYLPFADYFDESRALKSRLFQVALWNDTLGSATVLTLYRQNPAETPESWPENAKSRSQPTSFVLHSSDNPYNYFALQDTALARTFIHLFLPYFELEYAH